MSASQVKRVFAPALASLRDVPRRRVAPMRSGQPFRLAAGAIALRMPWNSSKEPRNSMEEFVIEGGMPLKGEVTPAGNKNAALPLLAACILTDEPVILHKVPQIRDVLDMRQLITSLGVEIEDLGANTWKITAKTVKPGDLDPDLCRRIRASILLAGPVVARAGSLRLPPPGGDVIGRRRLDTHMLALMQMGAHVEYDRVFQISANGLRGADVLLDEASVTATENIVMAAVIADGDDGYSQRRLRAARAGLVPLPQRAGRPHRRPCFQHAAHHWRTESSRWRVHDWL